MVGGVFERNGDVAVGNAQRCKLGPFLGQGLGMVLGRKVDHLSHTQLQQLGEVGIEQPAGSRHLVAQALPVANGGGVHQASPRTFAALSFMIPGITSSRKPTSLAAAIHLSGWISGKSLPNSIFFFSWVLA